MESLQQDGSKRPIVAALLPPVARACAAASILWFTPALDTADGADIAFTDVTAAAGLTMTYQPYPPMIPQVEEWMIGGMAIDDFNNDGWPDLFVFASGDAPDRLFMNNADGTFTDQASSWGIASVHGGAAACTGDFNRDGWIDIYLASYGSATNNQGVPGKNRLYKNNGNNTFTDVAASAGVLFNSQVIAAGNGCCFGDYDLDGDLDLAVAAWKFTSNGSRLFRNLGDGTFQNVTGVAISFPNGTWGFTPAFADMDEDGFPELLLAADISTSRYYKNNGAGAFIDFTAQSGTGLDEDGMGSCIGDFDNDGLLDWYVTSVYIDTPAQGFYNGNTLYRNLGNHQYVEISGMAGVKDGGWGWGTLAIDVDQDGWLDIMEVNGRPTDQWLGEREYLWRNDGDGTFTEVPQTTWGFPKEEGRAVAWIDYDRDGDLDLVIVYNKGPIKLFRNDTTGAGNWLQLRFDASANDRVPPQGKLTRVTAKVGSATYMRYLDGGHGYGSSSEPMIHFGLGNATLIDE
ncbi:MAG: CRTAC1 family protein, partial [Phycisphaerae bacterium]|nr:CRTAC1 family protein [Phycisphaerae bacterium]